jgi:uncharacterized protein (DUF1810 family)
MDDPHGLQRFLDAQQPVHASVVAELSRGAKSSHWMWFVFPQLKGLGRTRTAQHYGIASLDEAKAYWRHPVLGTRLKECTALMLAVHGKTALQVLGAPDDLKFRSSMTLFEQAAPDEPVFAQALERYFGGERDPRTLELLWPGGNAVTARGI